jgi:zinc protease
VTDSELQRVKSQVLASHTYQRDSVFYQAMQLGTVEAAGIGWQKLQDYVDKVNSITAAEVQKIASKYLIEDHLTIGYLDPLPIPEGAQIADESAVGGGHVR